MASQNFVIWATIKELFESLHSKFSFLQRFPFTKTQTNVIVYGLVLSLETNHFSGIEPKTFQSRILYLYYTTESYTYTKEPCTYAKESYTHLY